MAIGRHGARLLDDAALEESAVVANCAMNRERQLAGVAEQVALVGVDLVDAFAAVPESVPGPKLVCASVAAWEPLRSFDLITCVHGLHYIGDKLAVLTRAASWLTPAGRMAADLDLSAIRVDGGPAATRRLATRLRAAGFAYSARRHQITCTGRRDVRLPYTYLGADDRVGPGYTGQPAVASYYAEDP